MPISRKYFHQNTTCAAMTFFAEYGVKKRPEQIVGKLNWWSFKQKLPEL